MSPNSILDIGSGTGLLMLMLAQKHLCQIHGIEIDPDCFGQSKENITQSPWENRCIVFEADARYFVLQQQYDFIISNPPFYENQLQAGDLKKNMAKHSSHLNLSELLIVVEKHLTSEGKFGILLPYSRYTEVEELAMKSGLYCTEKLLVKQTPLHDYFRVILQFERNVSVTTIIHHLTIEEKPGRYGDMFIGLLKDFYLKL
jgi:tRNA1Val (adenine37-N6)-methyltransferase